MTTLGSQHLANFFTLLSTLQMYAALAMEPFIIHALAPPSIDSHGLYEVDLEPLGYCHRLRTEEEAKEQLRCIMPALAKMHSLGILQKDMRPTNVMRDAQVHCRDGSRGRGRQEA